MAYGALSEELLQWAMGKEKQDLSHDKTTVRTIEELRNDVEQAEQRSDLARLEGALIELASALILGGALTSATEMLQKAAGIQLGRGQQLDYSITLVFIGQVLLNQERFDEAMVELQRALTTFRTLDFRTGESMALGTMATAFHKGILDNPTIADELYQSSMEADPENANTLGDYVNFLLYDRKDFDKTEELYKRALEADPNHANNLGNYARFLSNIRKNFDEAEELYKRALEADPKHPYVLGNYAGMLLATGRQLDGLSMLDRAIDVPNSPLPQRAECWFYALAHRAPERRDEALAQLKRLIVSEGARSPGWDLSGNVERARSDGHPDAAWLALLADVIGEKAEPSVLDAWPAWVAA